MLSEWIIFGSDIQLIGASFAAAETKGPVQKDSAKIEDLTTYVGQLWNSH